MAGISPLARRSNRKRASPEYDYGSIQEVDTEDDGELSPDVSGDLMERAALWRGLARSESVRSNGTNGVPWFHGPPPITRLSISASGQPVQHQAMDEDVDRTMVAAWYVRDALAGRKAPACLHSNKALAALEVLRSERLDRLVTVMCLIHLVLPLLEAPQLTWTTELFHGWQPSMHLVSALECIFLGFYVYELSLLFAIRDHCSGRWMWHYDMTTTLRALTVALLAADLAVFWVCSLGWHILWYRWGRALLPLILVIRRTYLRLFARGLVRMFPQLAPVWMLLGFVVFFWGFLGYLLFETSSINRTFLASLKLFTTLPTSVLTMLRMFTSIPFMLDLEELYHSEPGIRLFCLSYALVTVMILGALVTAVANKLFQQESSWAYNVIRQNRAFALDMAHGLLCEADGKVYTRAWIRLMQHLRPDLTSLQAASLFRTCSNRGQDKGLSKGGFFQVCALANAQISGHHHHHHHHTEKQPGFMAICPFTQTPWWREKVHLPVQHALYAVISFRCYVCRIPFHPWWVIFHLAVVLQGVQLVLMNSTRDYRVAQRLEASLIIYFWLVSGVRMAFLGWDRYIRDWRNCIGISLNVVGAIHCFGWWPEGRLALQVYTLVMSSRMVVLWRVLQDVPGEHSDVASRVLQVLPAILRSFCVLLAFIYSYAILAHGMYRGEPVVGTGLRDYDPHRPMIVRWQNYRDVIGFHTMAYSLLSMLDVMLLSNWPIFMDAAADVTSKYSAGTFFYAFKVLTCYYISPAMLGFIIQSYMAADSPDKAADQVSTLLDGDTAPEHFDEELFSDASDAEGSAKVPVRIRALGRAHSQQFWGPELQRLAKEHKSSSLQDQVATLQSEVQQHRSTLRAMQQELLAAKGALALHAADGCEDSISTSRGESFRGTEASEEVYQGEAFKLV